MGFIILGFILDCMIILIILMNRYTDIYLIEWGYKKYLRVLGKLNGNLFCLPCFFEHRLTDLRKLIFRFR